MHYSFIASIIFTLFIHANITLAADKSNKKKGSAIEQLSLGCINKPLKLIDGIKRYTENPISSGEIKAYLDDNKRFTDIGCEVFVATQSELIGFNENGFYHQIKYYRTGKRLLHNPEDPNPFLDHHERNEYFRKKKISQFDPNEELTLVICNKKSVLRTDRFFILIVGDETDETMGNLMYFPTSEKLENLTENEKKTRQKIENCVKGIQLQQEVINHSTSIPNPPKNNDQPRKNNPNTDTPKFTHNTAALIGSLIGAVGLIAIVLHRLDYLPSTITDTFSRLNFSK